MIDDMEPNVDAMRRAAMLGHSTATDLADWLVRELRLPFREAHHITGVLVALADQKGCDLMTLDLADMQTINAKIDKRVFSVLSAESSVSSRKSFGGTAPANVRREAARWLKILDKEKAR
jgi:argininosuccinate lyase